MTAAKTASETNIAIIPHGIIVHGFGMGTSIRQKRKTKTVAIIMLIAISILAMGWKTLRILQRRFMPKLKR